MSHRDVFHYIDRFNIDNQYLMNGKKICLLLVFTSSVNFQWTFENRTAATNNITLTDMFPQRLKGFSAIQLHLWLLVWLFSMYECVLFTLSYPKPLNPSGKQHCILCNMHDEIVQEEDLSSHYWLHQQSKLFLIGPVHQRRRCVSETKRETEGSANMHVT